MGVGVVVVVVVVVEVVVVVVVVEVVVVVVVGFVLALKIFPLESSVDQSVYKLRVSLYTEYPGSVLI